jgi:pilus assembly protein CpaE
MSNVIFSGVGDGHKKTLRAALKSVDQGEILAWDDVADDESLRDLADLHPEVVVLGSELNGVDRFETARKLVDLDPTIGVLIIGQPTEEAVLKALEAGARAVLAPDSGAAEARKTLDRVIEGSRKLREHRASAEQAAIQHRTIVVVSAKGGAGKTMVSVNLAATLALAERRQTVIADCDMQFGDVAAALLLTPVHTLVDAAESVLPGGEGHSTALKVFLTRHGPTDLFALCGSDDPSIGELISPAVVGAILDQLAQEFRCLVVDTSAGLDEATLVALERATDIVIVVDLDVASVRGARKLIESLDLIGMRAARRHVVLNRFDSKVGLDTDEVQAALGVDLDVMLPSSRAVPLSFNLGEPLVVSKPRHLYSRRIGDLAARFVGVPSNRRGGR